MTRDIGKEILESIEAIQKGKGKKTCVILPSDVSEIRGKLHLSQKAFSAFMGVSVRTLQEWEQGRRRPSGPARSLLRIAQNHPEAFIEI